MLLCSRTHRCSAGPKEKGVALEGQPVGLRRAISSSPCQSSIAPLLLFQIEADRVDAVSLSLFCGPSSNTCPRCDPQRAQVISVRSMPCDASRFVSIAPGSAWSNDGQPVPESNFASELKSEFPQAAQAYVPSAFSCRYSPVNAISVPFSRKIRYCSGVSVFFQSSSELGMGRFTIPRV